jgi:exodeoxyribonuclease V alpha subunit
MPTTLELESITVTIGKAKFLCRDGSGYTIVNAIRLDTKSEITVKGSLPSIQQGAVVQLYGQWIEHPKYGQQFLVSYYTIPSEHNLEGMVAFLSSISGIKQNLAHRIVKMFGSKVYEIIENHPEELLKVKGIGDIKYQAIVDGYEKHKELRNLIAFLGEIGVSLSYANKIYDEFKEASIEVIKSNPYQLAQALRGFGFKRCDEIALRLGIAPDAEIRFFAALNHTLNDAAVSKGHCYLVRSDLVSDMIRHLVIPGEYAPSYSVVDNFISKTSQSGNVYITNHKNKQIVHLERLWVAEIGVACTLDDLIGSCTVKQDINAWIEEFETKNAIQLATKQKVAIHMATESKVMLLTGGAGCGKSLTAKAIYELWKLQKKSVVACAPTGRAAQRLREVTGCEAKTIHRLLEYNGTRFERNQDYPINADAFLIDECAMIDIILFHHLLKAIPSHAFVCMIGDPNQLLPIGAGNPFLDMVKSQCIPQVNLDKIFRQSSDSNIIPASLQIRQGDMPNLTTFMHNQLTSDTIFVPAYGDGQIKQAIKKLITIHLPQAGYTMADIQILSPMNKHALGNTAINLFVQDFFNPGKTEVKGFRQGDRVIQIVNNYSLDIYNGDIGWVHNIDPENESLDVLFDDKLVTIEKSNLDDLKLAYSISIHKSQGSEFPVVILPMSTSHAFMLNRNLFYTGFTRAKKMIILVGEQRAITYAVKKELTNQRNTILSSLLQYA